MSALRCNRIVPGGQCRNPAMWRPCIVCVDACDRVLCKIPLQVVVCGDCRRLTSRGDILDRRDFLLKVVPFVARLRRWVPILEKSRVTWELLPQMRTFQKIGEAKVTPAALVNPFSENSESRKPLRPRDLRAHVSESSETA